MFDLTNNDYINILNYYNIKIPKKIKKKSKKTQSIIDYKKTKNIAENILASKLCRCIKSVDPMQKKEKETISICTNSVFNKKGISYYNFSCKPRSKLFKKRKTQKKIFKKKKTTLKIKTKKKLR